MSQPLHVSAMFAFVAIKPDGGEAIMALKLGGTMMPLIGSDMAHIDSLRPMAQSLVDNNGRPVKLLRFGVREELETLVPAARSATAA